MESVTLAVNVNEPAARGVPSIVNVPAVALEVMSLGVKPVVPGLKLVTVRLAYGTPPPVTSSVWS